MSVDEVGDLDVVANAGAVAGWIILAEHVHRGKASQRGLHAALDQVGRIERRLAVPALRIGARDIEIAQRDIAEIIGARAILQHPLDHQLGTAIGRDRRQRRFLRNGLGRSLSIDGGGRGEDEVPDPALDGAFQQVARVGCVVEVIAERVRHRFRHDDLGREMGDGVDLVLGDQTCDQGLVAKIADDQGRLRRNRPGESRREIVDHDDLFAGVQQAQHHMAADIPGAACHQHAHLKLPRSGYRKFRNFRASGDAMRLRKRLYATDDRRNRRQDGRNRGSGGRQDRHDEIPKVGSP